MTSRQELTGVPEIKSLLSANAERLTLARRRQAAVWKGQKTDAWPIFFFSARLTPEQEKIPDFNFKEIFEHFECMLAQGCRIACAITNGHSDAVPSLRVNFGVGITLACLGLEQEIFPDKMPWPKAHLTRDQVAKLRPDDIRIQGSFERGLDWMRRFKEILGPALPVYCMDTQGPFDLAHLIMGDEIFYLLNDDPAFVHHLMTLCFELGVKTHCWMKETVGEPIRQMHHSSFLYMENAGIRICEDTTSLLGEKAIREFAMPYTRRLAKHFGGAFVHYCGRNDHLTEALCEIPETRNINFGHIPGHEHDHVFEEDMQRVQKAGKVYVGAWPRLPNENGKEFLKRMHRWAKEGCLVPVADAAMEGPDGLPSIEAVQEFWYRL
jgi:uroporphyrinogen-III decarboxylase